MSKSKIPEGYKAPLKKRSDIIEYLQGGTSSQSRYYEGHTWHYCWDVKCWPDLEFDDLVKAAISMGYESLVHMDDIHWIEDAKQLHAEHSNSLWDWGIEDAQRDWRGNTIGKFGTYDEGAPWYGCHAPDGDAYRMLWDGTMCDPRFAFFGRSGGWLTLTMFNGITLDGDCDFEDEYLWDYNSLRLFYRFLVQTNHDITKTDAGVRVTECAAFTFFANICEGECRTKESMQEDWLLDQSGEHDTIPFEKAS